MSRMQRFEWFRRQRSFRSQNSPRQDPRLRPRLLRLEPLEDRRMLAVITVDSFLDNFDPGAPTTDGLITLREAILAANTDAVVGDAPAGSGTDTIEFDNALSGQTIILGGTELEIAEALTIDAAALANNVTIDANLQSRIFNITAATGDFTIGGLTLTGGRTIADSILGIGGAIRSRTTGNLTIDQSTISGNSTEGSEAKGGGIFTSGALTLANSTVSGNSTAGLFSNGGGIYSFGVTMLTNSTVSGNSTMGNYASGGGMITFGDTTLASSTVTDNHAHGIDTYGGGIWNNNDVVNITNSIVAGNTATAGMNDIRPGTPPLDALNINYSLIGTGVTPDAGTSGNNVVTNNPLIGPLADNGGPTETHALLVGSSAIDAGDPAIVSPPPTYDQRGAPFVRVFDDPVALGSGIDIGAFELQPITDSADFDGDYDVDGADFLALQRGFGTSSASPADGDADHDNDVDGDDLGIWEGQFGQTAPVDYDVQARNIFFTNGLVTGIRVFVAPEWLETDQVWLNIEITGINDGFHEHGFQVVRVSDTTLFGMDKVDAIVSVDWTTDTNLTHSPEAYTVCVQASVGGQPFGTGHCAGFGPFLQAVRQAPVLSQRADLVDAAMAWEMASDVSAEEPALVLAAASVEQTTAITDELHQGVSVARKSADTTLSGNSTEEQRQEAPWLSDELLERVFS